MACAGIYNTCFPQGATWTIPFTLEDEDGDPISLSGASIAAKLRKNIDDTSAAATFTCTVTSAANGQGQALLPAATTAALTMDSSPSGERLKTKFFYDIEVTFADATVTRILEGFILVSPEVTR